MVNVDAAYVAVNSKTGGLMPFQSDAQRRFMYAKHPDIAAKWSKGQHSTSGKGKHHKMPTQGALQRRLNKKKGK
jgi:hypothetical protein